MTWKQTQRSPEDEIWEGPEVKLMKTSRTHLDWEPLWTEESTFFCFRFFKVCIHFWCMPSLELSFEANHPNESGICGRLWNLPGVYLVLGKTKKRRFVMFEHSSSGGSYLSWMIWAWSPQFRKPPFFQVFPNGAMPIDLSMRLFPPQLPQDHFIIIRIFDLAPKMWQWPLKTTYFQMAIEPFFWVTENTRGENHIIRSITWPYLGGFTLGFWTQPWHVVDYISHFISTISHGITPTNTIFFNSTYSIVFNMPIDWGANPPVWAPTQARFLIGYSP